MKLRNVITTSSLILFGSTIANAQEVYICTSCNPGSYSSTGSEIGNQNKTCTACPQGYYCPNIGMTSGTEYKCAAGYYCPLNSYTNHGLTKVYNEDGKVVSSSTGEKKCAAGYYCPEGSYDQYGRTVTDSSVKYCPAGYYCPTGTASGTENECPEGYYCPTGTASGTENECPAGYYCPKGTASGTANKCTAGHYCPKKSSSMTACTAGHMCPDAGMSAPTACSAGYFQDSTGQTSCTSCTPGKYCSQTGLTAPNGTCTAGYACPAGSTSSKQISCQSGNYYSSAGASSCDICSGPATGGGCNNSTWCNVEKEVNCQGSRPSDFCYCGSITGTKCKKTVSEHKTCYSTYKYTYSVNYNHTSCTKSSDCCDPCK